MFPRDTASPVGVQDSWNVDLSSVAALTFLVWDILITLDQEIGAIWSKPNKFYMKWLFLFVRYFAVAMQIALLFVGTRLALDYHYTESDCVKWYIFQEVGTQLLIASVEVILIIRVHALYDRNRPITIILITLFLAENIAMAVTLIKVVPGARFDVACTVVHTPPSLVIFAVAFVAFETVLFVLTLVKFFMALRTGWGHTPVIHLLVRDGTWAFALIFVTLCVNSGFFLGAGNSATAAVAFPWLLSIEAFAGARILLNLHALALHSSDTSDRSRDGAVSSRIVFTTHLSAADHPRTRSIRWDWGGVLGRSYDSSEGRTGTGTGSESYEMTPTVAGSDSVPFKHERRKGSSATNFTNTNTYSGTYVDDDRVV
ncbi:hypothetical protein BC834DRAFT_515516 [Gloeopeniophorella convolvens]|nr:hypothetical protein BC834DRAFT_515516 [Gloeopeniophorella convolvens]